jgi:hypothetical protein
MEGEILLRRIRKGGRRSERMRISHPLDDVVNTLPMRKVGCGSTGCDTVFL